MIVARPSALLLALALLRPAGAQPRLEEIARDGLSKEPGPARYVRNVKVGIRPSTLSHFAISESDPKFLYLASLDGYVYASRDGGLSFSVGRLISQRTEFFGAIRAQRTRWGAGFGLQGIFTSKGTRNGAISPGIDFHEWDLWGNFARISPYGQEAIRYSPPDKSETDYTDKTGLYSGYRAFGKPSFGLVDEGGGGAGGGDSARFGVGITRAAPRLMSLLANRGARLLGLNLKLLITTRGVEPDWCNHIAIHPKDPKAAFAATAMGLFHTTDGGLGWLNVLAGRNPDERWINFVAFHPKEPRRVYVGTGQGLLLSGDGGDRFDNVSGNELSDLTTLWLQFYEKDPEIIYAGTTSGVFRSDDGGMSWRWIFYETLPLANVVRAIAVDPGDPDKVQVATDDGLFRTRDGGGTWEPSGGLIFTGQWVARLIVDPHDGNHLTCSTERIVWETFDWGETWKAIYIMDSEWQPRHIAFDPHVAGVCWVLTSNELLRLGPEPPEQPRQDLFPAYEKRVRSEPRLEKVMDAAFRAHDVHRGERSRFRARTWATGIIPNLNIVAGAYDFGQVSTLFPLLWRKYSDAELATKYGLGAIEAGAAEVRQTASTQFYVGGMLVWDLSHVVFHQEMATYGRYFSDSNKLYLRLKYDVQTLYEERERVLLELLTMPPADTGSWLSLRLRLEELTGHLNLMTGGLYDEPLRFVEGLPWTPPAAAARPVERDPLIRHEPARKPKPPGARPGKGNTRELNF